MQQSYTQIIKDLMTCASLLPENPLYKTRPSKPAAFAMLARVFLSMGNYDKALAYADSTLQLNNYLIDFNTLDSTSTAPVPLFNNEDVFHEDLRLGQILLQKNLIVDSNLYQLYDSNDLRKYIFFMNLSSNITFKGSYDGDFVLFGGTATDEMYLIRAESYARKGNANSAMSDLNTLLAKRWATSAFIPLTANTSDQALGIILQERRKELIFRGLRWTDLRRLNKDPRFAITLTRVLNGQTYMLPPNDPRYVLPIPIQEIQLSGIQQNER
jgi:tetratricopeptide (TPR) repeat protein